MKKSIIYISTAILLVIASACSNLTKSEDPIDVGTSAPNFSLQSLDGKQVSLSDFSNKVVLLFFFGNG